MNLMGYHVYREVWKPTNSGEVPKSLHLIAAPPYILPTKFRHFVDCLELSWSELYMVRSKMVQSSVFHCTSSRTSFSLVEQFLRPRLGMRFTNSKDDLNFIDETI